MYKIPSQTTYLDGLPENFNNFPSTKGITPHPTHQTVSIQHIYQNVSTFRGIKSMFRFVKNNGKEYEAVDFFQGMQVLANKTGLQGHLHVFCISTYFQPL